ncbi:unnamed protein product [Owenia fusiformis]|uniref:Sidoreflexin n=1 Tax=Owenia fusiformis TaxID=6347 RepID=A0A8J1T4G3_OWEFU|nr:unnamed protein product [Owenia fusiformis]
MSESSLTGYPPFEIGKSRFDQSTFYGRWRHFLDVIDPRTLLVGEERLNASLNLLEDFKQGNVLPGVTNRQLWEAQKIKQATMHPDTGEKIFMPFRMAGFVPFGAPMVTGLLLPNQTFATMIFWQWINQSHNACVNYANRNATKETPTIRFVIGYTGAVSAAMGIAVGLSTLIKRANGMSPGAKLLIQRFVPFPAVATASVCNVCLMRFSEIYEGIDVLDEQGNVVGNSKAAAKKALFEVAQTRMFLPAPILIIPPIIMAGIERTKWWARNPRLHLPVNATIATAAFAFALPLAIALFPQLSSIKTSAVESDIQSKTSSPILFYNKGL